MVAPAVVDTVHLRGTAYEFNDTKVLLRGASIRVAEYPKLRARVGRDGTYSLTVPDRRRVTPYIVSRGYHTIYLQTFTTDGEDLERVNFQTPTEDVYRALAALLSVPLDASGNPRECAVVSTLSTREVRDYSTFAQFTGYGAHGISGATAFGSPALPPAVYFNSNVVPDRSQTRSSADGGVVWTEVPSGVYTVKARLPGTRFASFVASCEPGRVVNANPPWGLHELGLPMPALVKARWRVGAGMVGLRSITVTHLPHAATVTLTCSGPGCPLRRRTVRRPRGGSADFVGDAVDGIAAGQTVTLLVRAHAHDGLHVTWRLRPGVKPRGLERCVPLGQSLPRRRC